MGAAIVKMQIHMAVLDKISMTKISAAYLVGALAAYFLVNSPYIDRCVVLGTDFPGDLCQRKHQREFPLDVPVDIYDLCPA